MDSKDQSQDGKSTAEQPEVEVTTEQPEKASEETPLVTLPDGTEVSQDELTQGYMRQSDYTKKTQDLASEKKALEQDRTGFVRNAVGSEEKAIDPEVEQAAKVLKEAGFVTQEDLKNQQAAADDDRKLHRILDANPDLASKEDAIRAIGKTDNRAWEDIIDDYGFKPSNKIAKARASKDVPSTPSKKEEPKVKTLADIKPGSPEWETWKKENLSGSTF